LNRIIAALLLLKAVCVVRDPQHDLFRPISMYQTAEYAYLGTVFVALLAFASALLLRKTFLCRHAESLGGGIAALFALTGLLLLLTLADISYGGFHLLIAVAAMIGFAAYMFYMGRMFDDVPLELGAIVISALCCVPAVYPLSFGVIENVVLLLDFVAFWYLYYLLLEQGRLVMNRGA
jgi:hypothetical protein